MKRALVIISGVAVLVALIAVAVGVDISVQGALNTAGVERFPGADGVAAVATGLGMLGIALMVASLTLAAAAAVRRRQWGWLIALLALFPLGLYGWLALGFEGGLGAGAVPPLVPLGTLLYATRLPAERRFRAVAGRYDDWR